MTPCNSLVDRGCWAEYAGRGRFAPFPFPTTLCPLERAWVCWHQLKIKLPPGPPTCPCFLKGWTCVSPRSTASNGSQTRFLYWTKGNIQVQRKDWVSAYGGGGRVMEQTQVSFNLVPYSLCLSLQASPAAWKPALEVIMTTTGLKIPKCNNHRRVGGETTQITDAKTHSSEHTSPNQLKMKTEVPRKPHQRVNSASPLGFPRHTLTLIRLFETTWAKGE